MEKRLLCIFSHPDDEAYGPAGTIRHVAGKIDGRVRIVVATRGEAGTIGISKQYAPEDKGRVRQYEMLAAAGILEAEVAFLGFPDGGVSDVDPARALDLLVAEIRAFRPQVVLTFHPNGISGHNDHKAMTRLARAAFDAAADPKFMPAHPGWATSPREPWPASRLFYYGITKSRARAIEHFRKIEAMENDEADLALDVSAGVSRKHAACLAHGTQIDFYQRLQSAVDGVDAFWSTEHHVLGAWHGPRPAKPLGDLFED